MKRKWKYTKEEIQNDMKLAETAISDDFVTVSPLGRSAKGI